MTSLLCAVAAPVSSAESSVAASAGTVEGALTQRDLAELRRIVSLIVHGIESGRLDVAPGQYGAVYTVLALASRLVSADP